MKRAIFTLGLLLIGAGALLAQTYEAGPTYLSLQHNGTCGRMIGVTGGEVHVTWMMMTGANRHVYYNVKAPAAQNFDYVGGQLVDFSYRAGYACLAVREDGWCFPVFHQLVGQHAHSAAAIDYLPGIGAFTTYAQNMVYRDGVPLEIIWPKGAADRNGEFHLVSAENTWSGNPNEPFRLYYSKGTPLFDDEGCGCGIQWRNFGDDQLVLFDSSYVLAHNIACSRVSDRVARAWIRPPEGWMNAENGDNGDVFIQFSEDAGLNWATPINITQFIQPDTNCFAATGNARCCDRDTLRPYNDLSLLFDDDDWLHIAFTTVGYYYFPESETHARMRPHRAIIWHWWEQTENFLTVAAYWLPDSIQAEPIYGHAPLLSHPTLSLDSTTGNLYCAYLRSDTNALSAAGVPNADVFVSLTDDPGYAWSRGNNVTHTTPPPNAPQGANLNEQELSTAELTWNDELHLFYLLDQDAGTAEEASRNPMIYRRVSLDSIIAGPWLRNWTFHVEPGDCDTIVAAENPIELTREFRLDPPFPNPFNSAATISFILPRAMEIELSVYDVLGRRAAVLREGATAAGAHTMLWRAEDFASGVYFVSLHGEDRTQVQKILLVK